MDDLVIGMREDQVIQRINTFIAIKKLAPQELNKIYHHIQQKFLADLKFKPTVIIYDQSMVEEVLNSLVIVKN